MLMLSKDILKKYNINISKNTKVIFEGVDCSGKSTFENILMDIIGHTFLVHTSAPYKSSDKEYYFNILSKIYDLSKVINQPLFIDRFHIGELAYGKFFRPETIDKNVEDNMFNLEKKLLQDNFKIIYFTASKETIFSRLESRGDWNVNKEDIEYIYNLYNKYINYTKLPVYKVNTDKDITENKIVDILKFLM